MSINSFVKFLKWQIGKTESDAGLLGVPIKIVRYIKSNRELNFSQKKTAIGIVRSWVEYSRQHGFSDKTDLFAIRYHLAKFAAETFGENKIDEDFMVEELGELNSSITSFSEEVMKLAKGPEAKQDILNNPKVGFFGGTARLAVRMKLGLPVEMELPINDLDLIVSDKQEAERLSIKYGIDLAGIRILNSGNIEDEIIPFVSNVDCTMNQVGVCNGKIYYSSRAKEDLTKGIIRLVCKVDPLFGTEGVDLGNGRAYLNRKGFYRTLSFLIRGKGDRIVVSEENIRAEKDQIGSYWLSILFVKIYSMRGANRNSAVVNWYELAKNIGSTETNSPLEFLEELVVANQEFVQDRFANTFDNFAQAKWLVGKLVGTSADIAFLQRGPKIPETYTEANLSLVNSGKKYDLVLFWKRVGQLKGL